MSQQSLNNIKISLFKGLKSALFVVSVVLFFLFSSPNSVEAGQLYLGPATGTYSVGSTFDVQVLLNTDDQSINALDVDLRFPADRLQLVSPKTSVSVIEVWTSQPKFNNSEGTVRLQGGIPRGINVNNALVATLTFRVKSVGNAIIRFGDNSKVLLNDGLGTNDLRRKGDGLYTLTLPPPAGPTVVSETHPVQGQWYGNSNVVLRWSAFGNVDGYSYILDQNPVTVPDDSPDSKLESVVYKDLAQGQYYFHIKALREGVWGGVTHFAVHIDTEPPALFPVDIIPSIRTTVKDPVLKFSTTDTLSGIDHYELKFVPLFLSEEDNVSKDDQNLFIEAESPFVAPERNVGSYDVIVRAIDKAGNVQEVTKRFTITSGFLTWSSREGLIIGSILISWPWLILFLILIICLLVYLGVEVKRRHDEVSSKKGTRELPEHIRNQLEELKKYKSKYGTVVLALLFVFAGAFLGQSTYAQVIVQADRGGLVELAPPYVTTVSKDISNNEIFYVGGKTENRDTAVVIYTQNLTTGETTSYEVTSNKKGEWFYRHNSFLTSGSYVIWTQAKIGDVISPPSPQIEMKVARAAVTFGVTRISYETLFAIVTILLIAIVFALIGYILYHNYHHRRKHALLRKEIGEAEESLKRGFAVLRRDISNELSNLRRLQLTHGGNDDTRRREEDIFRDLKAIEERIGKEIFDIDRLESVR